MTTVRWTNGSIKRFAGAQDPVAKMEERARAVALEAMDRGWSGPPFDPLRLAEILGFTVEPRADVQEARVLYREESERFHIEFNPTRPQGRIFFSIAHEIAHTFFPDCKQRVRHRGVHDVHTADDWQVEVLCNIGAAELLMPVGSFEDLRQLEPSIEALLDKRRGYQVSTEAILIRYAKLADHPCAAFSASAVTVRGNTRYRLDYLVASRAWERRVSTGHLFDRASPIAECLAIGFTAKGEENSFSGDPVHVEAVGLPSYPGQFVPRVAGLLRSSSKGQRVSPQIVYVRGDALAPRGSGKRIVAHVVNDRTANWGGRGFAAAAKKKWPDAHRGFAQLAMADRQLLRLGKSIASKVDNDITLFSIVAQHGYGPSDTPRIRYAALEAGLRKLSRTAQEASATVHMPRIGTGNAGGSWPVIDEMIEERLIAHGVPVTVYDLPH